MKKVKFDYRYITAGSTGRDDTGNWPPAVNGLHRLVWEAQDRVFCHDPEKSIIVFDDGYTIVLSEVENIAMKQYVDDTLQSDLW